MKRCARCRKWVPVEQFRLYRSAMNRKHYLDSYCRSCRVKYYRRWIRRRMQK